MKKLSDNEIIQGIFEHNQNVLITVYHENYRTIRQLVKTNSGDDDDANDVFQDAIMVMYQKIRSNNLNLTVSFGTYFYSVAQRIWLNELKRKKRYPSFNEGIEFQIEEAEIIELMNRNDLHKLVWKHFEKISHDCQKVIKLFLEGKSIAEVTEIMKYNSEQHTKNRKLRCKNSFVTHIMNDPIYKELKK
jgi:RNA polymerase sigma factor (sigma-70 family)